MKRPITIAVILVCAAMVYFLSRPQSGPITIVEQALADFRTGDRDSGNRPQVGPLLYWTYHIDTYTQETDVQTIASLYARACHRLVDLYGREALAYSWKDQFGYDRYALVVTRMFDSTPYSHLLVTAYENNDNHSFSFEHVKGAFDASGKKLESSWALPSTFR